MKHEPMTTATEGKPGMWHGVFAGFAGVVVLVQLALAVELRDLAAMYRDFAGANAGSPLALPLLTRITLHPAWMWGVPLVGIAAITALLVRRPRSIAIYIAVAALLLVAAAATYYFPRAPIYALAGNIAG